MTANTATATPSAAAPLSILIIEDDADARANLCDILELDGYAVLAAGSLAEALACPHWSELFAVILDRKLPDGSAESFLPRIKELSPSAAIVIVTGFADLDGAIAALREGAADYILKPINADALRASLNRLAAHRRVQVALDESQEALRRERDFAKSLVETAPAVVLVLDMDGKIVRFNPYFEELTGYRLEELRGRDWFDNLLPPADRAGARDVFRQTIDGGASTAINPILTRDGRLREVRWSNKVLCDAHGDRIGVLAVAQDITELKEAQERALQSERLAAIGQMIAGLAHESRNALQRSQACLEMLVLEIQDRPQALDLARRTLKAQDHLHHLFEEVRGYAAPLKLRRQPADLRAILLDAWDSLALQQEGRHTTLSIEEPTCDVQCAVDRRMIEQVFRNILENSLAACGDPVEICVDWTRAVLRGQPGVQVSVMDNGTGLSAEQRTRIFEPFYTTKTHGTGLGMAITKRIVDAHGGTIATGSSNQPGAKIVVTLPLGTD